MAVREKYVHQNYGYNIGHISGISRDIKWREQKKKEKKKKKHTKGT